jgi:hypothetical protein
MIKSQALHIDAVQQANTTYDSVTQALTPSFVTFVDQPAADFVVISLAPATGTTITGVISNQGLTWTETSSGGPWVSSNLPMPAAPGSTAVNITITIDSEAGHDPTFTVKNTRPTEVG